MHNYSKLVGDADNMDGGAPLFSQSILKECSNMVEDADNVDGGAFAFSPPTPVPASVAYDTPISPFLLPSPAFETNFEPPMSCDLAPATTPSAAEPTELLKHTVSANLFSTVECHTDISLAELHTTDLTLDEIDRLIITPPEDLLIRRSDCKQLRNDLVQASNEWIVHMDNLRYNISRLEKIIERLEAKCSASPWETLDNGTAWDMDVRKGMKVELLKKLAWAEKEWEGLDHEQLECAERADGGEDRLSGELE